MSQNKFELSVIIPANNEEAFIGDSLGAVLAQDEHAGRLQIIVAANACTDRTEAIVRELIPMAEARSFELLYIHRTEPGKLAALNRADTLVKAPLRAYLDADVICEPELFGQLRAALDRPEPLYATGTLAVAPSRNWVTAAYGSFWKKLPFVRCGTVGAGLFAVNAAGRARWDDFPEIISDDTFVRLHFAPDERIEVSARYYWPMVEGIRNLVRVRRRQDAGVQQVYRLYPALKSNEAKPSLGWAELLRLIITAPIGFTVYALVQFIVQVQPQVTDWRRGR